MDGNYWWSGGIVGPIIGAIVGVWTYFLFIDLPKPKDKCDNDMNSNVESIPQRNMNSIYSLNADLDRNHHMIKAQV